jgi:hypothetical protein
VEERREPLDVLPLQFALAGEHLRHNRRRAAECASRTAEENFVNRIALRAAPSATSIAASDGGLLRFAR